MALSENRDEELIDAKAQRIIRNWMTSIVDEQAWERCDHLHVDQMNHRYKDRQLWVKAGCAALRSAVKIKEKVPGKFWIAMDISLEGTREPKDYDFSSFEEVEKVLHAWTSPSLYIFPEGCKWDIKEKGVEQPHLQKEIPGGYCYYTTWYDPADEEYTSTLWVEMRAMNNEQ